VIHFINSEQRDTSYDIRAIDGSAISTGDITIVRGLADPNDYAKGYDYLINPGDGYEVPIITEWQR
jgi:hypothetical protein